jgi:hypothetical protein
MTHTPRDTTLARPENQIRRARAYASAAPRPGVVSSRAETLTAGAEEDVSRDALTAFSLGLMTKDQAVKDLGLRDYSELLPLLGKAGLSLPILPSQELREQAALIAVIQKRP